MSGRSLVALLLLGWLTSAAGAVTTPSGIEVEVGVGGTPRAGFVTPVSLRLPAGSQLPGDGWVAVAAEDPDGQWVQSPPVRLIPTADGAAARLLVKLGRRGGDLQIVTLAKGDDPAADPFDWRPAATEQISLENVVESTQELLLVLSPLSPTRRPPPRNCRLAAALPGSPTMPSTG